MSDKSKTYLQFAFDIEEGEKRDLLSVLLAQLPFEGLLEEEKHLLAYVSNKSWEPKHLEKLNELSSEHAVQFDISVVENQNWNSLWEQSFRPILIPKVAYIHSSFHPKIELPKSVTSVLIDPKMAFGTGHHETTKMMLTEMRDFELKGLKVLDFGAGTGILAIAASKWKAKKIWAVEIDRDAYANMKENLKNNDVKNVQTLRGDESVIPDKKFNVILANVNIQVLKDNAKRLRNRLKKDGVLILSGVLNKDKKEIIKKYREVNFKIDNQRKEGDWCMLTLRRK